MLIADSNYKWYGALYSNNGVQKMMLFRENKKGVAEKKIHADSKTPVSGTWFLKVALPKIKQDEKRRLLPRLCFFKYNNGQKKGCDKVANGMPKQEQ